jgi:hypothetical protein
VFVLLTDSDSDSAGSEGWDSDDSGNEELDLWKAAEAALIDDPESFGPSSFGIIALGTVLELTKKLHMR